MEYFDRRYWQAIKAGDIEEANRIKAEWEQTEKIILNKIQLSLDATGIIDPTPISDGTNAVISALRGNYIEVGLSAVSIIPFAGDIIGKGGKYGLKYSDEIGGVAGKNVPSPAHSANAQSALASKLRGLEKAQNNAAKVRNLPDGKIRYYTKEVPAIKQGATRGASYVTEYNPKTGQTRSWMESYSHSGDVVRLHPKSINGQTVSSPHYPPTGREVNP